ncbi:MAG: accessory factor UbiK family protein [Alphaproteobacteria bacterium]|nr:accessory factor UbiK family protein [Alphaproteobacteria bacterium]OJV13662.1 MAG: hypothetical protein BGO27_00625 [Alphaproteobacteria bacterium 33-17]
MSGNDFFNELQKLTASAFSTVTGSAKHFEEMFKHNLEGVLRKMDFVKREELEIMREALAKSIEKQMILEQELKDLKVKLKSEDEKEPTRVAD